MNCDEECAEPNEVELSTEELVDLSLRNDAERTQPGAGPAASTPSKKQPRVATTSVVNRRSSAAGYVAAVAGVALIAAVAIYMIPRESTTTVLSHLPRWRALPDKDPEPIEEPPPPAQDLKPVRIRNAFDRTEVFEFPPGTTQQQARDAVAEILLNRAMERQSSVTSSR
jgi:hypothetical protein